MGGKGISCLVERGIRELGKMKKGDLSLKKRGKVNIFLSSSKKKKKSLPWWE